MAVEASDRDPEKVCNTDGCNAWKMGDFDYCRNHKGVSDDGSSHEGNQNAMKTGLSSDPVNLFDWCAENEPDGLAYILAKLHDYADRAPLPVFEADLSADGVDSFEDVEAELTAYGDDLILMCIRDYARWRASKQQLEEGLTTEQTRDSEQGLYEVTEANPVNLELDRMDKTTMQQKDKLGLLPSADNREVDALEDMKEKWVEGLQE